MTTLVFVIGILALVIGGAIVIVNINKVGIEFDKAEEQKQKHAPSEEPSVIRVSRWEDLKLGAQTDTCPRCGIGVLVYSHSNISLRIGSRIEYYYCLTCQMDTVAGKV